MKTILAFIHLLLNATIVGMFLFLFVKKIRFFFILLFGVGAFLQFASLFAVFILNPSPEAPVQVPVFFTPLIVISGELGALLSFLGFMGLAVYLLRLPKGHP